MAEEKQKLKTVLQTEIAKVKAILSDEDLLEDNPVQARVYQKWLDSLNAIKDICEARNRY